MSEAADISSTQTNAAPVNERGTEDAEVTQDAPPRKRVVSAAAESADFAVFDGPANDPKRARSARGAPQGSADQGDAEQGKPKRGRGRPKKDKTPATPEAAQAFADAKLHEARGLVQTFDAVHQMGIRSKYQKRMPAEYLDGICKRMSFNPAEVDAIAHPLAEGMAAEGVELPWWVRLGAVLVPVMGQRLMMMAQLDAELAERDDAESAADVAATAEGK